MTVVHLLESVQIKIKNGPGISFRKGFPEEPHEPDAVRKPRQGIMVGHEGKELLAPGGESPHQGLPRSDAGIPLSLPDQEAVVHHFRKPDPLKLPANGVNVSGPVHDDGTGLHEGRNGLGPEELVEKAAGEVFKQRAAADKSDGALILEDGQPWKSGILAEHPVDLFRGSVFGNPGRCDDKLPGQADRKLETGRNGRERREKDDFGNPRLVGHGTLLNLSVDAGTFGGSHYGRRGKTESQETMTEVIQAAKRCPRGGNPPGHPGNLLPESISKTF